jgi:hypothetical protein
MPRNPDDDLDPLDDRQAELEARFRELERDAEIERLRAQQGAGPSRSAPPPDAQKPTAGGAADPLASMKAALERDGAPSAEAAGELYLLVLCPHCQAKNRMSLTRVRTQNPICGGCKAPLAFTR